MISIPPLRDTNGRSLTEIEAFLSDLAVNGNCARSTQSQALNSIVFLYKQVPGLPVAKDLAPIRSKKPSLARFPALSRYTRYHICLKDQKI